MPRVKAPIQGSATDKAAEPVHPHDTAEARVAREQAIRETVPDRVPTPKVKRRPRAGTSSPPKPSPKPPSSADKRKSLTAVADAFKSFRPAARVFTEVRAVPTIFPHLDLGTRVGGWPIERSTLIHGPSNEGKTLFAIGLIKSFLLLDHFAMFLDAERTTPKKWVEQLLGPALFHHPRFFALKPDSFEEAREEVRKLLKTIYQTKENGHLPRETSVLIVADSMAKFIPKDMLDELLKATSNTRRENKDVDLGGRRWQRQAALNKAWLDELVVLLDKAGGCFVPIARETKDPNATSFERKFDQDYLVGGGTHLFYDSSLAVRIDRGEWIYNSPSGEYDTKAPDGGTVIGERHRLTIYKTKVGGKDDKKTICFFHSSNGIREPFGFDRARDLFIAATKTGTLRKRGSLYYFGERKIHPHGGERNTVDTLRNDPALFEEVEAAARLLFREPALGYDLETGEVFE
jgi:hypothetical protein